MAGHFLKYWVFFLWRFAIIIDVFDLIDDYYYSGIV